MYCSSCKTKKREEFDYIRHLIQNIDDIKMREILTDIFKVIFFGRWKLCDDLYGFFFLV